MQKKKKRLDLAGSFLLGRPKTAKALLLARINRVEKARTMELARLPVLTAKEVIQNLEIVDKAKRKRLKKMKPLECFSKSEVKDIRTVLRTAYEEGRVKDAVRTRLLELLCEKADIVKLAAREPELTWLVFGEVFRLAGISPETRKTALKFASGLATEHHGALLLQTKRFNLPGGKDIRIGVSKQPDGKWVLKGITRDKQ